MAVDMKAKYFENKFFPALDLGSGERIRVQILNGDSTVKEELCDEQVPSGKTGTKVSITYNVELT